MQLLKLGTYLAQQAQWRNTATMDYGRLRNVCSIPFSIFPHNTEKTMIQFRTALGNTYFPSRLHR